MLQLLLYSLLSFHSSVQTAYASLIQQLLVARSSSNFVAMSSFFRAFFFLPVFVRRAKTLDVLSQCTNRSIKLLRTYHCYTCSDRTQFTHRGTVTDKAREDVRPAKAQVQRAHPGAEERPQRWSGGWINVCAGKDWLGKAHTQYNTVNVLQPLQPTHSHNTALCLLLCLVIWLLAAEKKIARKVANIICHTLQRTTMSDCSFSLPSSLSVSLSLSLIISSLYSAGAYHISKIINELFRCLLALCLYPVYATLRFAAIT